MFFSVSLLIYFRILIKHLVSNYFFPFNMIIPSLKESRTRSKFDFLDPRPKEGCIKSLFSACRLSVNQQFSIFIRNEMLVFSDSLRHDR